MFDEDGAIRAVPCLLGLSLEPLEALEDIIQAESGALESSLNNSVEFAEKLLVSFFHYAQSWVKEVPDTGEQVIPSTVLQAWCKSAVWLVVLNIQLRRRKFQKEISFGSVFLALHR